MQTAKPSIYAAFAAWAKRPWVRASGSETLASCKLFCCGSALLQASKLLRGESLLLLLLAVLVDCLLLCWLSALVQLKRSASHHTAVCSAVQAIAASKEQAAMLLALP